MTENTLPRDAGPFRLLRELGRGGMGIVYEAEYISSGRSVALKLLSPQIDYSDEAYLRFEREARLAASISHPRCVFVLGVHDVEARPAIAMELMTGRTLEDELAAGAPIPIQTAVSWTLEILEGLAAARRVGVIHRDVKPSNCFLGSDGHVKIGDFGLSRTLVPDVKLTLTGQFLGSPLYASPEQVRGEAVDVCSDIYSVGATLYALLAGRPPFEGNGLGEILSKILTDRPPPLRSQRPQVPRGLARIVHRAMAHKAGKRYADHDSFRAALRAYDPASFAMAGPAVRSVALALDLGVLFAASVGILFVLLFPFLTLSSSEEQAIWTIRMILAAFWLGYFPVTEALFAGTRGGKHACRIQIVADPENMPSPVPAALCSLIWVGLVVGTLLVLASWFGELHPLLRVSIALAVPFVTARHGNGYRGLHEILSRTRVVRLKEAVHNDDTAAEKPFDPVRTGEGAQATIDSYRVQGSIGPTPVGEMLVVHDPSLGRAVWIHMWSADTAQIFNQRKRPESPARLRLIESSAPGTPYDIYEDPGGASLMEYVGAGRSLPWPSAYACLQQLLEELRQADDLLSVEQLWIDGEGRLRVLDVPLAGSAPAPLTAIGLLATATRAMLGLRPGEDNCAAQLPLHADPLVARLTAADTPFASLEEVGDALGALADRPAELGRRTRRRALDLSALGAMLLVLLASATGLQPLEGIEHSSASVVLRIVLLFGLPTTLLAFALRGGMGLVLAGVGLRTRAGTRASRLRCAARSLLLWAPAFVLFVAAQSVSRSARAGTRFSRPRPWCSWA